MRKIYSYLKGCLAAGLLLTSFGTASAAIVEGEFHFTSNMVLNDDAIKDYVSSDFDFTVAKKNAYYYYVNGFIWNGFQDEASIDDNSLVLNEYFLRFIPDVPNVAFANADGDYPELYYNGETEQTEGMNYFLTLTYDAAGNISIPDFTLVTLDETNHTTTILAKFTDCKAVNPANVKPTLMQLTGAYTFKADVSDVKAGYEEKFPSHFDFTAEYREGNNQFFFLDFFIPEEVPVSYDEENGILTIPTFDWYDDDYYNLSIADAQGNFPLPYFDQDTEDWTESFELKVSVDGSGKLTFPEFTIVKIIDDWAVPPVCEIYARYSNVACSKTDGFGDVDEVSFPGNYTITGTKLDYTTRAGEPVETTEKFKLTIGENGELLAFAGYPEEGIAELVAQGMNKGFFTLVSWTVATPFVAENTGVSSASTESYNESAEIKLLYNNGAYSMDDFTIWALSKETIPGDGETPDKTETVGTLLYAWKDLNIVPGWEDVIVPDVSPVGVHYFEWYKTDFSNPESPVTTKETMMFSINEDLQYTQIGGYNVDNQLLEWDYNIGSVNADGTIWTVELTNFGNVIMITDMATGEGIRVSGNTDISAEGPDNNSELVFTYDAETEEWNLTDFTIWKKGIINEDGETGEEGNVGGETFTKWTLIELWSSTGEVTEVPEIGIEGTLTPQDETIEYVKGNTEEGTLDLPIVLEITEGEMEYKGFQFDITVPAFLSLGQTAVTVGEGITGASSKTSTVKADETANTVTYRVISYFDATEATGVIATLNFTYDNADLEEYAPEVKNGETVYDAAIISNSIFFSSTVGSDIQTITGAAGTITIKDVTVYTQSIEIDNVQLLEPSQAEDNNDITEITQGEKVGITVTVVPGNSDEGIEWTVTVNGEEVDASDYIYFDEETGEYVFDSSKLEETLAPGQEATVKIQATSGDAESEEWTLTVRGVLLGDSNNNGDVTVADVVTTANYIVEQPVVRFDFPNANVILNDEDFTPSRNGITVQDVTATVQIVLGIWNDEREPDSALSARRQARNIATNDALVADNFNAGENTIGVSLENSYSYSAIQAIVEVPAGMKVNNVTVGPRAAGHNIAYNVLENGNVAVIIYSLDNSAFRNVEGSLFNIDATAGEDCDAIRIIGIRAADANSNGYDLSFAGGLNEAGTNGIDGIGADDRDARYFTVDGVEVFNPEKGQILIRVANGQAVKVIK